jgi:hypothetical protein
VLEAFEDFDRFDHGGVDDPGRFHALVRLLSFEGEAGDPVADRSVFFVAPHGSTAALHVLDLAVPHTGEVGDHYVAGSLEEPGVGFDVFPAQACDPWPAVQAAVDLGA